MTLTYSHLTPKRLRELKPGAKITERGITAECLRNGDLRYSINIMVDRRRVHRVIGCASEGVTRESATQAIESLRTKARERRLDLPSGRKTSRTLGEAAVEYIKLLEEEDGKNIKIKTRHLENNLVPYFGTTPLNCITAGEVAGYRKARLREGVSDNTVNRETATLSHLFTKAVENGWVSKKPKIKQIKEEPKDFCTLTEEEIDKLVKAAAREKDGLMTLYLSFGLNVPMRPAEILSSRTDHLNKRVAKLTIPVAKAGARLQPLTASLHAVLLDKIEHGVKGWFFPSRTKPNGHRVSINARFRKLVETAGLDPREITPYTLKRTVITQLIESGVDLPTAKEITGHKTLIMLLRYYQARGRHVDAAIAHLNRPIISPKAELEDAPVPVERRPQESGLPVLTH